LGEYPPPEKEFGIASPWKYGFLSFFSLASSGFDEVKSLDSDLLVILLPSGRRAIEINGFEL